VTTREEALLGTMRDAELAKRLNRTILSVRTQRLLKTQVRFIKTPRPWTAAELRMLGGCRMVKLLAAPDASWHRCAINASSLEFCGMRRSVH